MLSHRKRVIFAAVAPLVAVAPLILSLPSSAVAQTSWGFGVVIGRDQRPPAPPTVRGGIYWTRDNRYLQYAYSNGYADGREKGLEDGRRWRSFDPMRHGRYRSADHNYNRRYGPRFEYENVYRDGFRAGYEAGYRDARAYRGYGRDRDDWRYRDGSRRPY